MSREGQLRVVVVEDDPDTVEVLALMFDWLGCETRTAPAGLAAVDLARAFPAEIYFIDIHLPDIDGYEVARRIRSFDTAPLFVALSGLPQDHRVDAWSLFDQHFMKPIGLDVIRRILRAVSAR
jgi:two-component system OmpR family response regulator